LDLRGPISKGRGGRGSEKGKGRERKCRNWRGRLHHGSWGMDAPACIPGISNLAGYAVPLDK